MANQPSFSQRHGFSPQAQQKPFDELPPWVRPELQTAAVNALHNEETNAGAALGYYLYARLKPRVWKVLNREPPGNPQGGPWAYYIPEVIKRCEWWDFYDVCEEVWALLEGEWNRATADNLSDSLNAVFAREGLAWRFQGGRIERAHPAPVASSLQRAHRLLSESRFQGPDEQFDKACGHLNRRPTPDAENCVKDAVAALEGVANIVVGATGQTLSNLMKADPLRSGTHPDLRRLIEQLYAFRGSAPGVAHGLVGQSQVSVGEAEFVLAISAAAMVYLATDVTSNSP